MRTREVAQICGVSIPTITENAKKVGIVLETGKIHEWTEEELKKVQAQLMRNGLNRGNASTKEGIVEEQALNALKGGLTFQEIVNSGNIEAMKELTTFAMNACVEVARNKQLEAKNRELQAIVDKYVNWKSAREIKLEFKLPARPGIEKVAMLLNLKENEDWIARFYDDIHPYKKILYSPEAVGRIVEYVREI